MADEPLAYQRQILEEFLGQWDCALEYENTTDANEVHISLDMNLDSLNGKWLEPSYKLVSLSRLVQNICDIGNFSQLVKEPTRIMYNSVTKTLEKSCIDSIYIQIQSTNVSVLLCSPLEPVIMTLSPIQDIQKHVLQIVLQ